MAALVVARLMGDGYTLRHEIRQSPAVVEHSYIAYDAAGEERIADPTWQQFLPNDTLGSTNAPKLLVGQRDAVYVQARAFGINHETAQLWLPGSRRSVADQKQRDTAASQRADDALRNGAWERFTAAHENTSVPKNIPAPRRSLSFRLPRRQ